MAITVTHPFVSTISDDPAAAAAGQVVPSNWNATHSLSGTLDVANGGTGTTTSTGSGSVVLSTGPTFAPDVVISGSSSGNALRITQTGTGNALLIEDEASTDASPFRITNSGAVAIGGVQVTGGGGTFPKLQITGAGDNSVGYNDCNASINQFIGAGSNASGLLFNRSNSATVGTNTVVANGDVLGILQWSGADGTNYIRSVEFRAEVDGVPGTNDMPGRMVFRTTADGASSTTERFRIDNAGRIGIGSTGTVADTRVYLVGTLPSSSNNSKGLYANYTIPAATTSQTLGFYSRASTEAASFTVSQLIHYLAGQGTIGASSAVTDQYGYYSDLTLTGATNNYGFYSTIAASGSSRYNIYMAGTAPNYMAGNLGIGTLPSSDRIRISGTPSGSTIINSISLETTVGSGVTVSYRGVLSRPILENASFTLSNLTHFYANPQTKPAAATLTNQFGFIAESTLTDGTNNFGFYSNIASGANRWNFYAAGTAANYFAGATTLAGTVNLSGLTASTALALDSSKNIVSVTNTGSGDNVLATSPTLVTPNLGTPSAITLTNATGTASININGTVGATTRNTGDFTTLSASSLGLNGSSSGTVTVNTAAAAGTWTLTLPTSAGTNGYVLSTDGAGVTSWVAQSGGGGGVTSFSAGTTGLTPNTATTGAVTLAGTLDVANGGTGVTTSTGTGSTVRATSPTFVTPLLGTPTSGTLTNCTGLPVSSGISGFGTDVATALAVNVGSSGAFVTNGGALGTPSSGTVTNLTGTASININGTVGATTASTGAFTTLSASSTVSGTGFSDYLASPPAIGSTAANTGAFTTLSASSTVSGTGFSTYLASPPAIGGTTPATGSFTNLSATGLTVLNGSIASAVAGAEVSLLGTLPTTGGTAAFGLWSEVTIPSNATGQSIGISSRVATEAASFTAGTLVNYAAGFASLGASSSITNLYGYLAQAGLTAASNTNAGFFSNIAASGTSRWNFYANGSAPNYFAGPLGIGGTTTGDPLRIAGTINHAAFSNAQTIDATIGSAVTSGFRGVMSRPITQAATFTLASLIHFYANPQTKGAGSTITNQYGFFAESSITGATNNFGFYSNIASAAQRWNFYAAGTAANYFAGNTFIGATTGDQALNVNGAIRVSGAVSSLQTSVLVGDFSGGAARIIAYGASSIHGKIEFRTATGGGSPTYRAALVGSANGANFILGPEVNPSGAVVFSIGNGTAPTASTTDTVQYYSSDLSAGNTMPSWWTEGTNVGTGTPTANRTIAVRFNGTIYYLLASTIP